MSLAVLSTNKWLEQRTYTYAECQAIATRMANEAYIQGQARAEKSMTEKYETMYTLALVCSLIDKSFGFGKKRIARVLDLFFGQLAAFNSKAIEVEDFITVAKKVGVTIEHKDGKFTTSID